LLFQLFCRPTA